MSTTPLLTALQNITYVSPWNPNPTNTPSSSAFVNIGYTKGYVGVGTTAPLGPLQVITNPTTSGTVSISNGSTTVTGTGVNFLNAFKVGDVIGISGAPARIVYNVGTSTTLQVTQAYAVSLAGVSYTATPSNVITAYPTGNVCINGTTAVGGLNVWSAGGISVLANQTSALYCPSMTLAQADNSSVSRGNIVPIYAGDTNYYSFWGHSFNINDGGLGDAGAVTTPSSRITGTSSFTVNTRTNATTFNNLFCVRNSGNVGIGTTNPGGAGGNALLDVAGTLRLGDANASTFLINLGQTGYGGGYRAAYINGDGGNMNIINQQNGGLYFGTSNSIKMMVNPSGFVGIATNSPSTELTVIGTGTFSTSGSGNSGLIITPTSATYANSAIYINTSRSANSAFNLIDARTNASMKFLVRGDGNVGIGTASPGYTLDVNGLSHFSDAVFTFVGSWFYAGATPTGSVTISPVGVYLVSAVGDGNYGVTPSWFGFVNGTGTGTQLTQLHSYQLYNASLSGLTLTLTCNNVNAQTIVVRALKIN